MCNKENTSVKRAILSSSSLKCEYVKKHKMYIIIAFVDEDKIMQVSDKLLMGVNGDSGDIAQFSQYINKNLKLYAIKNGYQLDTTAAVHFTRTTMADYLRREVRKWPTTLLRTRSISMYFDSNEIRFKIDSVQRRAVVRNITNKKQLVK